MPVNRVTDEQVKKLIASNADINIFIDIATNHVDNVLVGQGLSAETLANIELYLAAHFVALTEEAGTVIQKRVGSTSTQYASPETRSLKGLNLTRFGATAMVLDTTGTLILANKEKAKIAMFGA